MDVWADQFALYIWSGEIKADLAPLKAAKAELGFEKKIVPFGVTAEAPPPSDCRLLAIGSRPPWVSFPYALVGERTSPEGWKRALSWVLGLTEEDPKATTVVDSLTAISGPGVREITAEELEAERKAHAYQTGAE